MLLELLQDEQLLQSAFHLVSEDRANKARRLKQPEAVALSLGAGLLLEAAILCYSPYAGQIEPRYIELEKEDIAQFIETEFEYRENGKPYIKGRNNLFFNLSHSGHWVICALSPSEVGCDIEEIRENDRAEKIAARYFTDEEKVFIQNSALINQGLKEKDADKKACDDSKKACCDVADRRVPFYRIWTLKESFMKVTGKGLALPLKDFSIIMPDEDAEADIIQIRHGLASNRNYIFKEFADFSGYCCSVCSDECEIDDKIRFISLEQFIGSASMRPAQQKLTTSIC